MDKGSRDIIDAMHRRMVIGWKKELEDPNLSEFSRDMLQHLIKSTEENFEYTYSSAVLPYHTVVVKHKRTEPRPLVWEEQRRLFLVRWWIKLKIWWDWYCNK